MRLFRNYLPNGMGKDSAQYRNMLRERLDKAMSLNSAAEQGYKLSPEEEKNLEDTVKDIGVALLGRRIKLGKKYDPFKDWNPGLFAPNPGPPSGEEIERVFAWASCEECSGQLTMMCPTCARSVLKEAKDALVEVKAATTKPEKVSFAIGIIDGVRLVLRMGHDFPR